MQLRWRLIVTLPLLACGDGDLAAPAGSGPHSLGDALVYLDTTYNDLLIVDPQGRAGAKGKQQIARFDAGEGPVLARSIKDPLDPHGRNLVVLDPAGEQVIIVRDKRGTMDHLPTGLPLEALDTSEDGRFGLAYQPEGATPRRTLFAFPNSVAVLHLTAGEARALPLRLGTAGVRPRKAVFSGPIRLSAETATSAGVVSVAESVEMALVFVAGGLVPVDLERGLSGPWVPLTADADREVLPAEVLFTQNRGDDLRGRLDDIERAFVRSNRGELFVLAVSLTQTAAGTGAGVKAKVTLENIVTPDAIVYDIELFFDADGNALLLAAAGYELVLVNGYTGVAARFPQEHRVDSLVRFVDPGTGEALALGYSRKDPGDTLLRLNPLALDRRRSTAVETLRLGSAFARVEVGDDAARAVVFYDDPHEFGVVELAHKGEVFDIRFANPPSTQSLDSSGRSLLLVSRSPVDNQPHLARVSLELGLQSQEVRLDEPGASVGAIGPWVWVDHGNDYGNVTFFPEADLSRDHAIALRGVLLAHLLDQPPPREAAALKPNQ